ncbi:hypothetical protein [Microbacterium sp. 18062]|uniref:hypothetical protein n=1 Tax=Microbacterium sp. 18062 TaxID=2681410 RepID=UPI0013570B24|nr:hypothetical protein [Microbacterium sp. 18062]
MHGGTIAAAALNWVDDAADGLDQDNVYVSPDVSGHAALEAALEAEVPDDGSIGVAVLPADAVLESAYTTHILDQIVDRTDYDTVIVAVGGDLFADSTAIDGDEAMRIANEAETTASGDLEDALVGAVQGIVAVGEPAPGDAPSSGDATLGIVLAVGAVLVVAAGVVATVVGVRRSRRRRTADGTAGEPPRIRAHVDALRTLRDEYARRAAAGDTVADETTRAIDALVTNVAELFRRLATKADKDQRGLAEIEYDDKLGKLVSALDRDYLLDLLVNPQLWEDPAERIREVRDALDAVSAQLVANIKQVNARRALLFQVSLDALMGHRAEAREWDREFRRAEDGDPDADGR